MLIGTVRPNISYARARGLQNIELADFPTPMASNTGSNQKRSYTIPCASSFCDTVSVLAESSKINVSDLARSVLLLVSRDVVAKDPYPGHQRTGTGSAQIRAERQ
jgi:hypothetical protein